MRAVVIVIGIVAVLVVAGLALSMRSSLDPIDPPPQASFAPEQVARGARLAAVGNCITCHTAEGGQPYAGGYAMATPFGTIYGTNITPDPDTGIGRWSEQAFVRAMREGVARDGHHLYPVFPYDYFTKTADEDLRALYAFLMTRRPVRYEPPGNDLAFPFNVRALMAGWNMLFLEEGPTPGDGARDARWNRGAYLVESLGHCGACHTPRNFAQAPDRDSNMAGGVAQDWDAPPLDASSPAPVPWTEDALFQYLRTGRHPHHGTAAGPMAPVVQNLRDAPDEDLRAMAHYIASLAGPPSAERARRGAEIAARVDRRGAVTETAPQPAEPARQKVGGAAAAGAALFAGACAVCHDNGRDLDLALSTAVHAPSPRNLVQFILEGVRPPPGESGSFMPGFAGSFTDAQITALAAYLRDRYSDRPAWQDLDKDVQEAREGQH